MTGFLELACVLHVLDAATLQSCLDPASQRPEIRDTLQLVIRQFDIEMMLQPGQQIQRLQAVDSQGREEVVIGSELFTRNFEVRRGQIQDFVKGSVSSLHKTSP